VFDFAPLIALQRTSRYKSKSLAARPLSNIATTPRALSQHLLGPKLRSSSDVSSGSSSGGGSSGGGSSGGGSAGAGAADNNGGHDEDWLGDLLDFRVDAVSSAAVPVMSPFGISTADNNNGLSNSDGVGAGSEWYATGGTSGNVYNNNSDNGNDSVAAAAEAEDAAATAACAATIANLESQKASAVASEDYMRTAALKAKIAQVREVETTRQAQCASTSRQGQRLQQRLKQRP